MRTDARTKHKHRGDRRLVVGEPGNPHRSPEPLIGTCNVSECHRAALGPSDFVFCSLESSRQLLESSCVEQSRHDNTRSFGSTWIGIQAMSETRHTVSLAFDGAISELVLDATSDMTYDILEREMRRTGGANARKKRETKRVLCL